MARPPSDEHFRSACSGGGRPNFARFDVKLAARQSDDRFFTIGTSALGETR